MLNVEFKNSWVTALRSGDYKQGTHMLKGTDNTFCCLGVACDLLVKKGIAVESVKGTATFYSMPNEIEKSSEILSRDIAKYLNIDTCPIVLTKDNGGYETLAELNDSGMSFTDIADLIEKRL